MLGDFDDAVFDDGRVTTRFYRRDGKFLVHTEGPGGQMAEFEITHTFGHDPLQQYLVPFPGGRLQTLNVTWDARASGSGFASIPIATSRPATGCIGPGTARTGTGCAPSVIPRTSVKGYDPEQRHVRHDLVGHRCRLRGLPRPGVPSRRLGRDRTDGASDAAR